MERVLTIIVPAYNMEQYLGRCLSSLLVESSLMRQFEVLVVNDGSKDYTSSIAHKFEKDFPETFRVIDKENGHYGSCVNRGLAEAKGVFVKILDADDAFHPSVFLQFLDFLSKTDIINNADVILSDFSTVNESGQTLKVQHYFAQQGLFSIEKLSASDRHEWFIHGLTYKTSLLHKINYHQTEKIAYTDHEWSFIPMAYAINLVRFEGPLYRYSVGREGQSVDDKVHAKSLWMEADVIERLVFFYQENKDIVDKSHQAFLFDRLLIMITHIYQLYLVTYKNQKIANDRILHLDKRIKTLVPDLYAETEKYVTRIGGINFYPVKNWRNHNCWLMMFQSALYFICDKYARFKKV